MKMMKREEKIASLAKTQDNHVSDYMGKITDACDSMVVLLAEL